MKARALCLLALLPGPAAWAGVGKAPGPRALAPPVRVGASPNAAPPLAIAIAPAAKPIAPAIPSLPAEPPQAAPEAPASGAAAAASESARLEAFFDGAKIQGPGAGEVSAESPESPPAPWTALERLIVSEFGLHPPGSRADLWRRETTRLLRNHPERSLPQALAEAAMATHELNDSQERRLRLLLESDIARLAAGLSEVALPEYAHEVLGACSFDGKLQVQAVQHLSDGIEIGCHYERSRTEDWTNIGSTPRRKNYDITSGGLWLYTPGDMKEPVDQLLQNVAHAGERYAVFSTPSGNRLFVESGDLWKEVKIPSSGGPLDVVSIAEFDGELYAATSKGIFKLKKTAAGRSWIEASRGLAMDQPISFLGKAGRRLIAFSNGFIFELKGGAWTVINRGKRNITSGVEHGGALYVADTQALYELQGDALKPLWRKPGKIRGVFEHDGGIYVAESSTLGRFRPDLAQTLPADWDGLLLRDLAKAIGLERGAAPPASERQEPPAPKDDSVLVDEDSRPIFSVLRAAARPLISGFAGAARLAASNLIGETRHGAAARAGEPRRPQDGPALHELSFDDQMVALFDKYEVPPSERRRRKGFVAQAVARIKLDLALFTRNPDIDVQFGEWWMTIKYVGNSIKSIRIPLEDIFIRAVDSLGVKEAVGGAFHESLHYKITSIDPSSKLVEKYALTTSPPDHNLLYQAVEDTRINTWGLVDTPGYAPYLDAIYDAEWPEDPEDKNSLKRSRLELLSHSTLDVKMPDGRTIRHMPAHVQYLDSIIYYWRHRKAPPFLTDELAKKVFADTKDSLDRIRHIHPRSLGGVVLEESKRQAWRQALEALDREVYPHYQKLREKAKQDLSLLQQQGGKAEQGGSSNGAPQPGGSGSPSSKPGGSAGKPAAPTDGTPATGSSPEDILRGLERELAGRAEVAGRPGHGQPHADHGHPQPGHESPQPSNGQPQPVQTPAPGKPSDPKPQAGGDAGKGERSWLNDRDKIIKQKNSIAASYTDYDRYKMRASELGLIGKVDGVVKKLLQPATHARLSRTHYDDGDEPDIDKHYDDLAQGRLDAPIMQRWNRPARRTAKISLVLDISGSMGTMTPGMTSPLDYALIAVVAWIEVCQKNNLDFEIILFDQDQHTSHRFGAPVTRQAKEQMLQDIASLRGGSTAIGAAFEKAVNSIAKQRATHRWIIFATDGDHNTGDAPEKWKPLAKKHKVVTVGMIIGKQGAELTKHFDYAVSVDDAKNFPKDLLNVLKLAIKTIMGRWAALAVALVALCLPWLGGRVPL